MLKYKSVWRDEPMNAVTVVDNYANNGRLYVGLWCDGDGYWEPWCDITVNLFAPLSGENCAYVDENNCPGIGAWLEENELATPTGRSAVSGWNTYAEYKFDMEKVQKHCFHGTMEEL